MQLVSLLLRIKSLINGLIILDTIFLGLLISKRLVQLCEGVGVQGGVLVPKIPTATMQTLHPQTLPLLRRHHRHKIRVRLLRCRQHVEGLGAIEVVVWGVGWGWRGWSEILIRIRARHFLKLRQDIFLGLHLQRAERVSELLGAELLV